ncbi:hypothetical protein [Actinoalloteichus hymeniacidonis]|uniref:hypothetical protein n=1 Tax=Actinoalloteichus hymeniacidonis TaxID=340345 RepID=UPI0012FC12CD|nr:hypothetical protein [Actinoalloteichus hymeniacidonis]MBB5907977.1 hypothetical protein [Actinoalloteichus hymeniacidonis]
MLAVDFDSAVRPIAGFGQLVELMDFNRAFWHSRQPPSSTRDRLSAEEYLDHWAEVPHGGGNIDAVLGYCVGCVFAPALVERIEQVQGHRPELLLFDPEPAVVSSLYQDFRETVESVSILSGAEREQLVIEAGKACLDAGDDFDAAAAQVIELYEAAVSTAFARLSLDPVLIGEFTQVFRSYVSYLSAAAELSPEDGWQSGIALTARGSSPGARHARKELSFPVGSADLLRDRRVAETVFDLLSGGEH